VAFESLARKKKNGACVAMPPRVRSRFLSHHLALASLCAMSILSSSGRCAAQETTASEQYTATSPETWRLGDLPPDGYRVRRSQDGVPFVVAGSAIFLATYAPMLVYGMFGSLVCAVFDGMGSGGCDPPNPGFLMIPVVGPFLYPHPRNGDPGGSTRGWFVADGIAQASGLGLAVVGGFMLATAKPELVKEHMVRNTMPMKLQVLPMIGPTANGLTVLGSF
jgi:hypothetical protein